MTYNRNCSLPGCEAFYDAVTGPPADGGLWMRLPTFDLNMCPNHKYLWERHQPGLDYETRTGACACGHPLPGPTSGQMASAWIAHALNLLPANGEVALPRRTPGGNLPDAGQAVRGVQAWMALDLHTALGLPFDPAAEHQGRDSWADWWADLCAQVRNIRRTIRSGRYAEGGEIRPLRNDAAPREPLDNFAGIFPPEWTGGLGSVDWVKQQRDRDTEQPEPLAGDTE